MPQPRAAIFLFALSILLPACGKNPEDARRELGKLGVQYTEKAFVEAAKNNDNLAVRLFLEAGMNPNVKDDKRNTALSYAVEHGNIDTARSLLDKDADVNAPRWFTSHPPEFYYTPLMIAAFTRDREKTDITNLLLERGADVNQQNNLGVTALIGAAFRGNTKLVERLLSAGANVNLKRWDDTTALFDAVEFNYPDIVTILIKNHADVNARNIRGGTPLVIASLHGHEDIIRILLDAGANPNQKYLANNEKKAAMHEKFKLGDFDPVLQQEFQGRTAIMFAAEKGHSTIVKRLLDAGADPYVRDLMGNAAFSLARKGGHAEVLKLLEQAAVRK